MKVQSLQTEYNKEIRNDSVLETLMDDTYPSRREEITSGAISITDALKKYPPLHVPSMVRTCSYCILCYNSPITNYHYSH